ncbi:hypothetical protein GCM10017083_36430 [Thalassobaculum fulvum]|uniref:Beta-barrel assembly machine subunit BamF n=1 Tax=Thalassobaculum fulvum TaxID=1633335 RepID=A0A918XV68_9PROT|nr:DUF3035 domain-containing protein [Thalassobaculum fulvum]GHD56453.1 hypothetical protein GCM10017083_36430 [Thalassobaculum fulvum]
MGNWKARRRSAAIAGMVAVAALLGGCSQFRGALGYDKDPPDEFQVVARAPLALPPNYDLRPPEPGADRPQELSPSESAAERILGRRSATSSVPAAGSQTGPAVRAAPRAPVGIQSSGETALREQLQLDRAEPNIRQIVNRETADFVYETEYPIDKLLFWKEKPPPGVLLDAEKESKRLRENSALGRPVDTGETPSIQRRRGGILEGLF